MEKLDLMSMNIEELTNVFYSIGQKSFRAKQLFKFIHDEKKTDINEITVFSLDLREKLAEIGSITKLELVDVLSSTLDGTKKFIFKLADGNYIESVYLESHTGSTVCLSSQVGCKMGCEFCASTKEGFERNLRPSEMLAQIYQVQKEVGHTIDNMVLMGIGEPFDNYNNVMKFVRLLNDPEGQNMGIRNMTISTCGLVKGIRKLADEGLGINLAVSLHNGIQEEREKIMPISKSNTLEDLKEALNYYQYKTNRRISYEYALIKDDNDSYDHARAVKNMAAGLDVHVNLIPLNPIDEFDKEASSQRDIKIFQERLEDLDIKTTIRRKQGADIDAACGQLRNAYSRE